MNTAVQTALTPSEQADLGRFESVISAGLQSFLEVGNALLEINDRRLYRSTHSSFKDYCRKKWTMTAARAFKEKIIELAPSVKPLNRKKIPTPARGFKGALQWWEHSATPERRGDLLQALLCAFKPVKVKSKDQLRKYFERLFDSCVEEEK